MVAAAASRRILLVEDNSDVAYGLKTLLELDGHVVRLAQDGAEAIESARASEVDVVLCDLGLPGEIDGFEVARTLRRDASLDSIRLVAVTGFGQESARERALAEGFDDYVTKPVELPALRRLLGPRADRAAGD